MAWPGNRVQQMVIAKLSLRLSLNNPSNIVRRKFATKRHRERERERKRASELDAKCYETAGNRAPQVEFPSSVLPGAFCECAQQHLLGLRQV